MYGEITAPPRPNTNIFENLYLRRHLLMHLNVICLPRMNPTPISLCCNMSRRFNPKSTFSTHFMNPMPTSLYTFLQVFMTNKSYANICVATLTHTHLIRHCPALMHFHDVLIPLRVFNESWVQGQRPTRQREPSRNVCCHFLAVYLPPACLLRPVCFTPCWPLLGWQSGYYWKHHPYKNLSMRYSEIQ